MFPEKVLEAEKKKTVLGICRRNNAWWALTLIDISVHGTRNTEDSKLHWNKFDSMYMNVHNTQITTQAVRYEIMESIHQPQCMVSG
jgi:hypothetical protein